MTKLGGLFGSVTRTDQLNFGSCLAPDLAYQWDTKRTPGTGMCSTECRPPCFMCLSARVCLIGVPAPP